MSDPMTPTTRDGSPATLGSDVAAARDAGLSYGALLTLTEGHGTSEVYERVLAALARERERGEYEGAANAWDAVASLAASGTPTEGIKAIATRNAAGLRAAAIRQPED